MTGTFLRSAVRSLAVVATLWLGSPAQSQETPRGLLAPGDAAVTGFAGAVRPIEVDAGTGDSLGKTRINLSGPTLRIVDLHAIGGRPSGQFVNTAKPYTFTAAQIGQVFGVALDNATPPNIYAAASSAYGLPIVVKTPDNKIEHVVKGQPGAYFMPGLFGFKPQGGGPGSIWRIDGVTGAVTLFANAQTNGAPNPGPALGGLVYDVTSDTMLAADRWSGQIHRYRMDGSEVAIYDHGVEGRRAAGLTPIAPAPTPFDVASPNFDSADPATWGYAAPERRVFGLGVRGGRLYYAVAGGLEIWSVSIRPDGGFGKDARRDIVVPPGTGATEISRITFDDQGRMYLAERAAPTGAPDFEALAGEGVGRVLRYTIVDNAPDGAPIWQAAPNAYATGFPRALQNANGGVALGYDYDEHGHFEGGACSGFVWSTGEDLRDAPDPKLAQQLARTGPLDVSGLQGQWVWQTRPRNVPPLRAVFTDYDDHFQDSAARAHMGDLAIWRVCGPAFPGGWMFPDGFEIDDFFGGFDGFWTEFDEEGSGNGIDGGGGPPSCPPDQKKPGFHCCPKGTSPGANGQCKSWCPDGSKDPAELFACALGFDPATQGKSCLGGAAPLPGKVGWFVCAAHSPILGAAVCPAGYAKTKVFAGVEPLCMPTKAQQACPPGQNIGLNGKCEKICKGGTPWPIQQCCPAGSQLSVSGKCCAPGSNPDPKTGLCLKPGTPSTPGPTTTTTPIPTPTTTPIPTQTGGGPGTPGGGTGAPGGGSGNSGGGTSIPGVHTCDAAHVYVDGSGMSQCCSQAVGPQGQCCSQGYGPASDGKCCVQSHLTTSGACCPPGKVASGGQCIDMTHPPGSTGGQCCVQGSIPLNGGVCCPAGRATSVGTCCPAGQAADARGTCVPTSPPTPSPPTPSPTATTSMPTVHTCSADESQIGAACCPTKSIYARGDGALACCPQAVDANGRCIVLYDRPTCAAGFTLMPDKTCCPNAKVSGGGSACLGGTSTPMPVIDPPSKCPDGATPDARGACPGGVRVCPDGRRPDERGVCPVDLRPCPDGRLRDARGNCPVEPQPCPDGRSRDANGNCSASPLPCPDGRLRDARGNCPAAPPPPCPDGKLRQADGTCPVAPPACLDGKPRDARGACPTAPQPCLDGKPRDASGNCPVAPPPCPNGRPRDARGNCSAAPESCPNGKSRSPSGECPVVPPPCPDDRARDARGNCQAPPPTPRCGPGETLNDAGRCESLRPVRPLETLRPRIEPPSPEIRPRLQVPLREAPAPEPQIRRPELPVFRPETPLVRPPQLEMPNERRRP